MELKMSKSMLIKYFFNIFIPVVVFCIPCNEVFTMQMKLFFVSTVFAILCFAFETLNQTAVALALPVFWIYAGVAPAAVAFQPWTQYVPWMTLGGLVLAAVMESCGLLQRIAYWCLSKVGNSYAGVLWGIGFVSAFLFMFVGSLVVPVAALCYGICLALKTGKSKASAGILLVGAMGQLVLAPTKMTGPVIAIGIASPTVGPIPLLGYFESFWVNAPIFLEYILLIFICTKIFKPDTPINGKEYFAAQLATQGKITVREIKCAAVLVLYLVYILTYKKLGLSLECGMALLPYLVAVPGIGAAKDEDFRKINFGFIVFVTACMGIGAVAGSLGLGAILVELVMPILEGQSYYMFFLIEWLLLVIMNFVMTPLAMEAAFSVPLVSIGMAMGINPQAIIYFMLNAIDQVIMPYQYALYMVSFAFEIIRMGDFMKIMGIKMLLNFIMVFALLLTWWKFIGFLFV